MKLREKLVAILQVISRNAVVEARPDPRHLTAPWTLTWQKFYTPGYEFIEVDCRVPFTYREPG